VGRIGAVDAVLPARFPEYFVAAEEGEVNTCIPRRLNIGALRRRPVFVVADRQEGFVLRQHSRAIAVGIHTGAVADLVAVGLEPADHRILGGE
jgi:hypothetical protein